MRIPWRDTVATLLVGTAVGVYLAQAAGPGLPGLHAVRPVAGVVVGLGVLACVIAAWPLDAASATYGRWVGTLAAAAVIAAGVALIGGSSIALMALVATTAGLWVAATVRHLTQSRPRITDRDLHGLIDREKVTR